MFPGEANYLLFRTKGELPLQQRLERRGVLLRPCGNYRGLDNRFYRIAVRSREENGRLLTALTGALEE